MAGKHFGRFNNNKKKSLSLKHGQQMSNLNFKNSWLVVAVELRKSLSQNNKLAAME